MRICLDVENGRLHDSSLRWLRAAVEERIAETPLRNRNLGIIVVGLSYKCHCDLVEVGCRWTVNQCRRHTADLHRI